MKRVHSKIGNPMVLIIQSVNIMASSSRSLNMWCRYLYGCFSTAEPDKIFLQIFSSKDKTKIMMIAKFAKSVTNWQGVYICIDLS